VRRLFVVDDEGRLAGVVSRRDLLRVYLRTDDELLAGIEAFGYGDVVPLSGIGRAVGAILMFGGSERSLS
jgi:CBS domain-containing protein